MKDDEHAADESGDESKKSKRKAPKISTGRTQTMKGKGGKKKRKAGSKSK